MLQRDALRALSLKPAHAPVATLPALSLRRRPLGALAGVFRWPVFANEDWLQQHRQQHWHGLGMLLVVALHAAVIAWMVVSETPPLVLPTPEPMTVSLITLPAKKQETPAPEVVPIIQKQPVKTVTKPKETPVKSIERPAPVVDRIVETTSDQPRFEASTQPSAPPLEAPVAAAPIKPVPAAAATPKPEPAEEKEEPPKFGVAYLNNPRPDYPRLSQRAGEEGKVLMKVLVSAEGLPESVEVIKTSGFERLDKAAVTAVKQWRFEPARKGGKALSAYVNVPLSFSLTQN